MERILAQVRAWRSRWETRAMDVVYDLTRVTNDGSFASHRGRPVEKDEPDKSSDGAPSQNKERSQSDPQ